jgi:hypothetical protein
MYLLHSGIVCELDKTIKFAHVVRLVLSQQLKIKDL